MATYNDDVVLFNDRRFTYDGDLAGRRSTYPVRVLMGFDLAANGIADFFTLDDTAKGVLDNVTYTLVADTMVDVTDFVRSFTIRRGRSRQLDRFTAGNANIVLDNRDRAYDPTNVHGIYYGQIVPRKPVVIDYQGQRLYSGMVEDWNFGYTVGGDATAEPSCTDGFAVLAGVKLAAGTSTAQGSGARVSAVLDAVAWPDGLRAIETGDTTLAADVVTDGTGALEYLQRVETSEAGALFMDVNGALAFRARSSLQVSSAVAFGPDDIPFVDMAVVYGTEEMTNTVAVTYPAGTATATDATAVAAYGVMDSTYTTLLADGVQAQALADYVVATYSEPVYHIDRITVAVHGVDPSQAATVLTVELGDVVRVTWTPNGRGAPIVQYANVDSIEHQVAPATHLVTLTLSQAFLGFILDDAARGVLDTSSLGF